ncbi:MAG: hypothetical protein RLZZ458_2834, partial [Planctomycetota bacterium]
YGMGLTDVDVRPTEGGGVDGRGRPSYGSGLTDVDVRRTEGGGVDGRGRPSYGMGVTDVDVRRTGGRGGSVVVPTSRSVETELNLSVLDDLFADLSLLP